MRAKLHLHRRPRTKIGVPPGTLIHVGERKAEQVRIRFIFFNADSFEERDLAQVEECLGYRDRPGIIWIEIDGIHDTEVIETIGRSFGLHPLVQEDILNTGQRPKLEDYDDFLFLVVKMLQTGSPGEIRAEQVSLILGRTFVLSFQETEGDVFDQVRERLRTNKGRIRRLGADYLAYTLLDALVDIHFVILEDLDERIEELEDELVAAPGAATLHKIHQFKREMIFLRRSVWPLREVISAMQRQETLVREETRVFLRDVYDHTIQVVETVETYRDVIAGMLDLYLSSLSFRMNEVMKVLTIIATIFIPLTFIAGVYGMNFEWMPELHWRWAYPTLWVLMAAIAGGMVVYFRKKKWF